jgi:hypothetical protein
LFPPAGFWFAARTIDAVSQTLAVDQALAVSQALRVREGSARYRAMDVPMTSRKMDDA